MNVLIIGSGGREHAIGWKIKKDNKVDIYFAPGNGGTTINLNIQANDLNNILEFAREHRVFTIVGPEEPLARGIVNLFNENDLAILGPTREAAILEYSKAWAKDFMKRHGIRTAEYRVFDDPDDAKDYVKDKESIVVKADGLAFGKGAFVCKDSIEAIKAIDDIMVKKVFGDAGNKVVVEERLEGEEVSFIALSDGKHALPLATSQDHKRLYDGDQGPNTGGMGAYSPVPFIDDLQEDIMDIINRVISGMRAENREFKGFIYAGLMISANKPYVLEFNVRLGDPETQAILPRMESNMLEYAIYASNGKLDELEPIRFNDNATVCVVLASKGYPSNYEKGKVIYGLDNASSKALIFHAGTVKVGNDILTNGGRVLSVTAIGRDIKDARERAYEAIKDIHFDGMHYRKDIGVRALNYG